MSRIQFHKIWVQQCRATRGIKRRFGVKSALEYLLGEKLINFANAVKAGLVEGKRLRRFLWHDASARCMFLTVTHH